MWSFVWSMFALSSFWFGQLQVDNILQNPSWASKVTWVQVVWAETRQQDSLVNVIKWFVNWTLWILALLTLIIFLRWWFKMVTAAGNEEQYWEWFKILKQAAMWIWIIWIAWFIVSIIFYVITLVTVTSDGTGWWTI